MRQQNIKDENVKQRKFWSKQSKPSFWQMAFKRARKCLSCANYAFGSPKFSGLLD
jgi:hypothetical protein